MTYASSDLEALISAHSREVQGLLMAITRNQAIAEELTQEVFLVALRKEMRPGPGVRHWLRDVARKLALNELRRKRPEPLDISAAEPAGAAAEAGPRASFEEELAALRHCLAELGEPDRRLLASRYERQEPLEVAAADFSQSIGYLKQRLFRLRRRLAECVGRRLGAAAGDGVARA
ncbi:MAG TPA: sigma-70 family RNA polymerase sigma factor [Planctomycetota bacterium]|nr:sigma-70 family RNA polymerase sigma factor [Planctomycetota bacterium]